MQITWTIFGATYNCGAYGAGTYDSNQACQTSTDGGSLAPTGDSALYGLGGGIILVVVGVVLLVRMRRSKKDKK